MKKGFTDKALTKQLAAKLESESRQRRLGLIDIEEEEKFKKKQSPIAEHLDDYKKALGAKDNSEKHVKLTLSRIQKVIDGCEFTNLKSLNADDVETFLGELRKDEDVGYRTYNHYLQAIDGFCNWMVSRRRLASNPIAQAFRD